jgi:hypothetical protein
MKPQSDHSLRKRLFQLNNLPNLDYPEEELELIEKEKREISLELLGGLE